MNDHLAGGAACTRCSTPIEEEDLRCAVCALAVDVPRRTVDTPRAAILRCTECGAAVAYDANQQAPACRFCGAVMAIEQPVDPVEVARRRLPFLVDRRNAQAALRVWLGQRGFFAPRRLKDEAVFESLHPLCWAAWVADARALVSWAADSNAGSRRSAWAPHAGQVSLGFERIVVSASRGLRADECDLLVPHYDMATAVPIGSEDGLPDEDPQVESFDTQRSAARAQVQRAIELTAKARVERGHIPGTLFRKIQVSCLLEQLTTDRVVLPAWVLAYRYRGASYRAVVHGQNPHLVIGSSPTDIWKVALVTVAAIVGLLALFAVAVQISR